MMSRLPRFVVPTTLLLVGTVAQAAPAPSKPAPAAPSARAVAEPAPARPYSPEELKALQEAIQDTDRFKKAADSYRATVNNMVRRAYDLRRKTLLGSFDVKIRREESEERTRRVAAITLFEDFLRRYPHDRRWTPDVLFRLAELYFEKSSDEYLMATEQHEKDLRAFEKGQRAVAPTPPKQSYQQTIDLYRRLIREFPSYRLVDGAYYLLGFCLSEMGETQPGNQAFLSLVCSNRHKPPLGDEKPAPPEPEPVETKGKGKGKKKPLVTATISTKPAFLTTAYNDCTPLRGQSKFTPESWIRIGEYHFDENQLGSAIAAYRRVLDLGPKDNAYYDEALYKLAWTYYRADRFPEAIKHFDMLMAYADKEQERTGKLGSDMRPESLQYLGVSFAEEDWDGDTAPDAETGLSRIDKFYAGRDAEKHVFEVYRRLADIYFDTTRYDDAIKVYKVTLKRWPYHGDNPDIQDKVILAMERLRRFDEAIKEREEFTRLFGKGTEWERRNRNNPKALRKAREYDEQALIQAAVFHHKAGQELKKRGLAMSDGKLLQQAATEYELAARAYQRYLERFPDTKNSYEIRYSYASCLYYSQKFLEAGAAFAAVRDSNLDNRYQEEAAFSATKAYEEFINQQVREKKLPDPPLPKTDPPPASLAKIELPEPYKKWQESLDAYARVLPASARTPRLVYKAAEVAYRFMHFDDARRRFGDIYQKYCKDPMAITAGQAVLVMYQLEKNLNKMEEWATKLKAAKCGGEKGSSVAAGAAQLLEGIKFRRAEDLMKAKQWDKAAKAYLDLVNANPKSEDADKALNNAAVCFENSKRFESATKIYERIWRDYPNSPQAHEALWRSALNYQRFFNFKQAVTNYLILSDSPRFSSSSHRTDAIYNAATILENDQDYARSAQLFLRYASVIGKPKEAAEATFRAGKIYEKMNDFNSMLKIYRDFPRTHGTAPGQGAHAVEATFRIAASAQKRRDLNTARKFYRQTLSEFSARGQAPGSDAAGFAAQAAFELAEERLRGFLGTKIKGALNTLKAQENKMAKQAVGLKNEYERIWTYKFARWTLAAMYRAGGIYEHFARTLAEGYRSAPIPPQVKRLGQEALDLYQSQLDQKLDEAVRPYEETAKKNYEVCVTKSREFGVSNEYTEEALKRLNAFDPTGFPLLKKPRIEVVIE